MRLRIILGPSGRETFFLRAYLHSTKRQIPRAISRAAKPALLYFFIIGIAPVCKYAATSMYETSRPTHRSNAEQQESRSLVSLVALGWPYHQASSGDNEEHMRPGKQKPYLSPKASRWSWLLRLMDQMAGLSLHPGSPTVLPSSSW